MHRRSLFGIFVSQPQAETRTHVGRKTQRLQLEMLESRLLLHGDSTFTPLDDDITESAIVLRDGRLIIQGDKHDNAIAVSLNDAGDQIECTVDNLGPKHFSLADVQSIHVRAGAGNDDISVDVDLPIIIRAGRGHDEITGGEGSDQIRGGRGNDTIDAEGGDDTCAGGKGDDSVIGGEGDDRLYGGKGPLHSHSHHHSGGDDILLGGEGDDMLAGGRGSDAMDGEDGADTLKGGHGRDTFAPNDGDDFYRDFKRGRDNEGEVDGGDTGVNDAPTASPQNLTVVVGTPLSITLTGTDGDPGVQQTLSFRVQTLPTGGTLRDSIGAAVTVGTTLPSANLTYTPNAGFTGNVSFTFIVIDDGGTANGGQDTSSPGTVSITVRQPTNQPFGPVTPGPFDDPNLLGTRTDLLAGAPTITQTHLATAVDYTGFSNPPTYGPHHGAVRDAQNNSITPRPTGVYTTEQPDEDMVHNLEHGQVWISYNPSLLNSADKTALAQLVQDGGTDTGVILTPRSQNTSAIALASWAHLLTLSSFDATQIRNFVVTNRGHSPEGFMPSGQRSSSSAAETVDDGLLHTRSPIQPFGPVTPGSSDAPGLRGTRTDLLPGAPAVTETHVTTAVDYTGYSNPPTYGPHHGAIRDAQNNSITPRPTGVYTTEQPDEDLLHNLEHGHVWISYNPTLLSATERQALEQFIAAGGTNTGVILTPRSTNTSPIVLSSWTRQLTLNSFNAVTIRDFVETNRGKSPEGFITSGQKPANGEQLNDGLPHSP